MPNHLNCWTPYITIVTYRTLSTQQPMYLVTLVHFSDISRTLRTSISFVPKTKLNIGKYAFSVAAPTIRNQLPITIKSYETVATVHKKTYKTHLFEIAFPLYIFSSSLLQ